MGRASSCCRSSQSLIKASYAFLTEDVHQHARKAGIASPDGCNTLPMLCHCCRLHWESRLKDTGTAGTTIMAVQLLVIILEARYQEVLPASWF